MEDLKNSFMIDMEPFISGSVGCAGNSSNLLKSESFREAGLMTQTPVLLPLETESGTSMRGLWLVQGLVLYFSAGQSSGVVSNRDWVKTQAKVKNWPEATV